MTNDYKEQLLNYVTGNLQETSPTTNEIFEEIIEANRSDWIGYMPNGFNAMRIEGLIKSNTNGNIVLYGGYKEYNTDVPYGFIILLDNNFKPIKYFDKYKSGTRLRYIQSMNQDIDGTFYFMDDAYYPPSEDDNVLTSQKRFVMVNNFTTPINNEYVLNLRTSYILNSNYQNFYCRNIQKNPETSHYVMVGETYKDSANRYLGIKEIELIINVGIANEWSSVETPLDDANYYQTYGNSIVSFNSKDEAYVKIITAYLGNEGIHCLTKDYTATTFTYKLLCTSTYPSDTIDTRTYNNQSIFLNPNEVYFVLTNQQQSWDGNPEAKHIALMYYNFNTNTIQTIFDKPLGTAIRNNLEVICLSINQNKLYIEYCVTTNTNIANYYIQRFNGTWNPILLSENKNCVLGHRALYVDNDYNLLKIFCYSTNLRQATWYFPIIKEIYNPNNYNGQTYIENGVFNPLYSNLYSNGSLVFSRNLYNISKQNNMTMASVEIPNTYLNDLTITQNDLISETNFQMNSDSTNWTKNIYEVVDLNFLNTISVIDNDTNTPYLLGATRINNSITDVNDYSNATCNKVRINYVDNTTKVFPILWEQIDSTHKQTIFSIYVDKAMKSIDYISNDTNTIYCNKPLNVEVGNYYTINQKIMIGE